MPKEKKQLHIFENDNDTIVAYSVADAVAVWEEAVGEKYIPDDCGGEFEKLDDKAEYTLYEEELIKPDPIPEGAVLVDFGDGWTKYRASLRAWANARGRCLLGSIEF